MVTNATIVAKMNAVTMEHGVIKERMITIIDKKGKVTMVTIKTIVTKTNITMVTKG
jgi:hypothetical protein